MRNVSDKSCTENQNTHFVFSNFFSSSENCAVYEIMWENIVKRVRLQMTIWRMYISHWVPKATNTHSEYVNTKIGYSASNIRVLTVRAEMMSQQDDNIKPTELPEFCVSSLCSWQSCWTKNRGQPCARIWQIRSSSRSNCQTYLLHALGPEDAASWASRVIVWTDSYCFTKQHSQARLCNGHSACFLWGDNRFKKKYYSPNLRPVQVISIRTPIRNEKRKDWKTRQEFFKLCPFVLLPACLFLCLSVCLSVCLYMTLQWTVKWKIRTWKEDSTNAMINDIHISWEWIQIG